MRGAWKLVTGQRGAAPLAERGIVRLRHTTGDSPFNSLSPNQCNEPLSRKIPSYEATNPRQISDEEVADRSVGGSGVVIHGLPTTTSIPYYYWLRILHSVRAGFIFFISGLRWISHLRAKHIDALEQILQSTPPSEKVSPTLTDQSNIKWHHFHREKQILLCNRPIGLTDWHTDISKV